MAGNSDADFRASGHPAAARLGALHESLAAAFGRLQAGLEAQDHDDAGSERRRELVSADMLEIEAGLAELERAVDSLAELQESPVASADDDRIQAVETELEKLKIKLDEQSRYRDRLNSKASRYKAELEKARAEIEMLRGSFAFRVGSHLVAAAKGPRDMALLPVRLGRLARDAWPRIRNRIRRSLSRHDVDGMPDLGPDISLARDAAEWADQQEAAAQIQRMLVGTATAPELPSDVSTMRIATIMDEFSFDAFRHCGDLRQIGAEDWQEEVEAFAPHMLLVESAWKGRDESWARKVYPLSRELVELVAWCRDRKIPTVFWNKEDPVHLSVFMRTARQFDFVFTTDIDCVRAYKAALGHEQVYWLPFACQPTQHNPMEEYQRKDGFCFAGSFYAKYPDRQRDFATLVDSMGALRPFEIFDRNAGKDDPALCYPERYQSLIQGALPYERISLAYKGYRYGININTVKQSQSMFARRAFDLLACNTVTISNYSRGLRNLLGDLVISSDDGAELRRKIEPLLGDECRYRRFRLAGLRKVMSGHTYQDRLRYVLEKVGNRSIDNGLPELQVIARAESESQYLAVVESFQAQRYERRRLIVIVPDALQPLLSRSCERVDIVTQSAAAQRHVRDLGMNQWLACFHPADHYGANYLTDLALATRYSGASVIGKAAYHQWRDDAFRLVDGDKAYVANQTIPLRRAMTRIANLDSIDLSRFSAMAPDLRMLDGCSIDEFNYCADGSGHEVDELDDLAGLWAGIPQSRLHYLAESAVAGDLPGTDGKAGPAFDATALAEILNAGKSVEERVALNFEEGELRLRSGLPGDKHVYLYASRPLPVEQLFLSEIGKFNFVVDTEMLISFVLIYLDGERQRIGHAIRACSSNLSITPPAGTRYVRLGLRVQGPGEARIKRLVLGHVPSPMAGIPGRADTLVISRGYPSYGNLYSYAYVHRRVLGYSEMGTQADVFRLSDSPVEFDEYEGIDVVTGQLPDLELMLRSNSYKNVLVHSLDRALWSTLKQCASDRNILIWVHGAEIQPWYRRDFSFIDAHDRERGVQRSNDRMAFWGDLLASPPPNVTFIFVSRHLVREAERDVGIKLAPSSYVVIHNHIDGEFFDYQPKDVEQRKRLLSIRPYNRPTYANELTVRAILDLADEPYFNELRFHLIGDGRLFDSTVEPVLDFPNVIVEKRFLAQAEIAELHKRYGVFLVPSRIDSQGVSRDEAMSSGLVPVTNRVSAIPEFVDESCAFMVDPEDHRGIADSIRRLYADPDLFSRMSAAAAARVRSQSGRESTLREELTLLQGEKSLATADGQAVCENARRRVAVYGDMDLNLIDGSAIWVASLARVLALGDECDVDLFLKCPIGSTKVLRELLGLVNVRLIEPPAGIARRRPVEALDAIQAADVMRRYQAVILRGFDLAGDAAVRPALEGRVWVYLTDIPQSRGDFSPEQLKRLGLIAEGAARILCQTPQLEAYLCDVAPEAAGKTALLPPMVPDIAQGAKPRRERGGLFKLAYAGKFAPLWGIRELFEAVERLRSEGIPIELHVFGDKIHNPSDDPGFRPFVKAQLEGGEGVIWHRGLDRTCVLEQLGSMDAGWAWRQPRLEEETLELSTKVLEYLACGLPPILAASPINKSLLGTDYPLFVDSASVRKRIRALALGELDVSDELGRIKGVAERFSFSEIFSHHLRPLLDHPSSGWKSGMRIDAALEKRLRILARNTGLVEAGRALVEKNEVRFNGFPPTEVNLLADWTANPHASRGWNWNTAAFNFVPGLLAYYQVSGDDRALDFAVAAARSWGAALPQLVEHAYEFAAHDHATALQLDNLIMLMSVLVARHLHLEAQPGIKRLILKNAALLERDEFYSRNTNHGVEQSRALALAAHCFPEVPEAERRLNLAMERLLSELDFAFTAEGVHVENSPAYHVMVCNVFIRVVDALPEHTTVALRERLDAIMRRAMVFLCHMLRPDGVLPIIGDTQAKAPRGLFKRYMNSQEYRWLDYSISQGERGEPPTRSAVAFPESGYLVARDRWRSKRGFTDGFHLVMKCGWHSAYHRHDDDLNVVLYYGEDWLLDGGGYSYNESDPLRRYLRSKWAHNVPVIEADGDPLAFRAASGHKASLEVDSPMGPVVIARARTDSYPGYRAYRDIEVRRAERAFIVRDRVQPEQMDAAERMFRSLWHIPSDKRVLARGQDLLLVSNASGKGLRIRNQGERFDSVCLLHPHVKERDVLVVSPMLNQIKPCQLICFGRRGQSFDTDLIFEFVENPDLDEWREIDAPAILDLGG